MTDDEFFLKVKSLRWDETMGRRYHLKKNDYTMQQAKQLRKEIDTEICRRDPSMTKYLLPGNHQGERNKDKTNNK